MKKWENELLYGAAYYAEYMPYDRVEEDFRMMKEAGMNVIRIAESTWSTLEYEDGKFDFSYIDRVLEEAKKQNLYVIIGTPTYAVPSWLVKKDPDVMVTNEKGREWYGRRQIMNIVNTTYRYHAERIIRVLIEHTVNHSQVIGFQIDNETKHYGTVSEDVQELFIEHLKEKFGTVENLNKAYVLPYWSNSIARWEDFPDIRGTINAGLAGEFAAFQRKLAADFLNWQAAIVREYAKEEQFITHNFDFEWRKFGADIAQDGYSYGVQPDINHYEASGCLSLVGTDIYHPTQDDLTGAEIAYGGDSIRSLKQENYIVLECQAQAFKYWTPYPGQLRLQAYSHLASGACGLMYWNWHSIHNSYETYWKGVLSHDLMTNPTYEEACRYGEEWKRLGANELVIQKKNQVALVVDNRSLTAFKWFPIDRDLSYNDVVRWMYDSLYEMNIECDVVDVNVLQPEEYKMIITPALYSVREDVLQKLQRYVENGGVLLSSFKSFVADENLTVYHDTQPYRMHDCFGMSYNQFSEPGRTKLSGKPVQYFMELLKPEGTEVLTRYEHKYWGRYAAITRNTYGKGRAYYIGCYTDKSILKELYQDAVQKAGIEPVFPDVKWPVTIRSGINRSGKTLHYIFNYSENENSLRCSLDAATDLLTGRVYHKGETIVLGDWEVVVLRNE